MNKLTYFLGIPALWVTLCAGMAAADQPEATFGSADPVAINAPKAEADSGDMGLFSRIPLIEAVADINGLKAWVAPTESLVFMRDPKSGAYLVGFPFDAEGRTLIPGAAEIENSGLDDLLTELFAPHIDIPEAYAPTVQGRLALLSDAERNEAINRLIASVRDVGDEPGFNKAIEAWIRDLPAVAEEAGDKEAAPAADLTAERGPSLLDAVRNAAYIEIGDRSAPLAYVILDPSCHACRAAMAAVKERVDAGELQLRVLLVPAVSADSPGVIAGLAATGDIGAALMGLGAQEDAALPYERPGTLSDVVTAGISRNYELAKTYQLPSMPFFIYEKADGPSYVAGLPSVEQFEDIILADPDKISAEHPVQALPATAE